jgi:hypothetical protein
MKHVFILFLCSFFIVSSVDAQDQYMVRNIAVDAEGGNAIEAKDKALTRARRNGFETLAKRLGVDAKSLSVNDRSIATMVNSFEINREKSSKNRYLASVNVMFNESAVQAYLGRNTNMAMSDGTLNNSNYSAMHSNAYGHSGEAVHGAVNDKLLSYKAEVVINGLSHLVDLKRTIGRIPTLGGVAFTAIKSNRAVIEIKYSGDAEGLKTELMHRGIQLWPNRMMTANAAPYILIVRR